MTPDQSISFQFSTDGADRSPTAALRELNDRNVVFCLDALSGKSPHASIRVHSRPDLRILDARLSGVRHSVGPVRDGDDELLFATTLSGTSVLNQDGVDLLLKDGDAVLLRRGTGPFTLTHAAAVRFVGLRIPDRAIRPLVTDLDAATGRRIPPHSGVLDLLIGYLREVARHRLLASSPGAAIVSRHVHDLVALIVGTHGDASELASARGVRAARLQAIKSDAAAHLANPSLTAAAVAARHGISVRYVHQLFEPTGSTFSRFVLERRLARAHRMLTDRRFDRVTVSAIAFAVGFGDLSYFNRTFRRVYGCSPSDVRREPA
ncbi:MAG TPA: AraC family transcriptional regulator [Vicinamibacterales bacterium]|jgi:AraC-like DNA-binding protein